MSVKAILTEQAQDTATVLAIKSDTTNLLSDTSTLKTDVAAIKSIVEKEHDTKRYGFRRKISEANSADRIEYLYDAVGMTPVSMDMSTGAFNYGSWANIWFIRDNYPCMLTSSGVELYKLNPNDYSLTIHGEASQYNDLTFDGNAMSAIPLCWVKRYTEGDYEYFIVCEKQYDETYHAYAHTDASGNIKNVVYHAMFEGSLSDGKLRSIAGQAPENNTNTQTEVAAAKANGNRWNIRYWSLQSLIADLLTLISKNDNSQAAFGQGNTEKYNYNGSRADSSSFNTTGELYNKGQFYGRAVQTNGYYIESHKVFHIENFWGERWDRCLGLIQTRRTAKAKMTPEGNGYIYTDTPADYMEYEAFGAVLPNDHGWQTTTYTSELGTIPTGIGGGDSVRNGDFLWINPTYGGVLLALCGGVCNNGSGCGSRCVSLLNAPGGAFWDVGASLTCI